MFLLKIKQGFFYCYPIRTSFAYLYRTNSDLILIRRKQQTSDLRLKVPCGGSEYRVSGIANCLSDYVFWYIQNLSICVSVGPPCEFRLVHCSIYRLLSDAPFFKDWYSSVNNEVKTVTGHVATGPYPASPAHQRSILVRISHWVSRCADFN